MARCHAVATAAKFLSAKIPSAAFPSFLPPRGQKNAKISEAILTDAAQGNPANFVQFSTLFWYSEHQIIWPSFIS